MNENSKSKDLRSRAHEIIFEADTFWGKLFDVVLLIAILLSVVAVMLETVTEIRVDYGEQLVKIEWFFTFIFTIEYVARLWSVKKPLSMLPVFLE
nr:ion transporter [Mangrovivirga cuniculi]